MEPSSAGGATTRMGRAAPRRPVPSPPSAAAGSQAPRPRPRPPPSTAASSSSSPASRVREQLARKEQLLAWRLRRDAELAARQRQRQTPSMRHGPPPTSPAAATAPARRREPPSTASASPSASPSPPPMVTIRTTPTTRVLVSDNDGGAAEEDETTAAPPREPPMQRRPATDVPMGPPTRLELATDTTSSPPSPRRERVPRRPTEPRASPPRPRSPVLPIATPSTPYSASASDNGHRTDERAIRRPTPAVNNQDDANTLTATVSDEATDNNKNMMAAQRATRVAVEATTTTTASAAAAVTTDLAEPQRAFGPLPEASLGINGEADALDENPTILELETTTEARCAVGEERTREMKQVRFATSVTVAPPDHVDAIEQGGDDASDDDDPVRLGEKLLKDVALLLLEHDHRRETRARSPRATRDRLVNLDQAALAAAEAVAVNGEIDEHEDILGLDREVPHHHEARGPGRVPSKDMAENDNRDEQMLSPASIKLPQASSLPASAAGDHESTQRFATPAPHPLSAPRRISWYNEYRDLALVILGLTVVDRFFPWSPISRWIRHVCNLARYFLLLHARTFVRLLYPVSVERLIGFLSRNEHFQASGKALASITQNRCSEQTFVGWRITDYIQGLSAFVRGISDTPPARYVGDVVRSLSYLVYLQTPSIEPSLIDSASERLSKLEHYQTQLEQKVKDLMRSHESWALEELRRMRSRRAAYTETTNMVLAETKRVIQQSIDEAKANAANRIHDSVVEIDRELTRLLEQDEQQYALAVAEEGRHQGERTAEVANVVAEEAEKLNRQFGELVQSEAVDVVQRILVAEQERLESEHTSIFADITDTASGIETSLVRERTTALAGIEEELEGEEQLLASTTTDTIASVQQQIGDAVSAVADDVTEVLYDISDFVDRSEINIDVLGEQLKKDIAATVLNDLSRLQDAKELAKHTVDRTKLAQQHLIKEGVALLDQVDKAVHEEKLEAEKNLLEVASGFVDLNEGFRASVEAEVEHLTSVMAEEIETEYERILENQSTQKNIVQADVQESKDDVAHAAMAAQESVDRIAIAASQLQTEIATKLESTLPQLAEVSERTEPATSNSGAGVSNRKNVGSFDGVDVAHMALLSLFFVFAGVILVSVFGDLVGLRRRKHRRRNWRNMNRQSWQQPATGSDSEPEEITLFSSADDGVSEPEPEVIEQVSGYDPSFELRGSELQPVASIESQLLLSEDEDDEPRVITRRMSRRRTRQTTRYVI